MEANKSLKSHIKASIPPQRLPISPISPSLNTEEDLELVPMSETTDNDHEPLLGGQEASSTSKPLIVETPLYDPHHEKVSPLKSKASFHNYDEEKVPTEPNPRETTTVADDP